MTRSSGSLASLFGRALRWLFAGVSLLTLAFATLVVARSISIAANIPSQAAIYVSMLLVTGVLLVFIMIHELGHAGMAAALGWRVSMIVSGSLAVKLHPLRVVMGAPVRGIGMAGAAFVAPSAGNNSAKDFIAVFAAGPLVNVATGLLLLEFAPWHNDIVHSPIAVFGFLSLYLGIANLMPFSFRLKGRSDGGNILDILRGADLDARTTVMHVMDAIIRGVRPRKWDQALIAALIRKSETSCTGWEPALLYSYYFDCGETGNARASLDHAISIMGAVDALLVSDAFLSSLMESNFPRARACLSKVRHKRVRQSSGYLTVLAILETGEGDLERATRNVWLARKALRKWPLATDCEWEVLDEIDARIRNAADHPLEAPRLQAAVA